MAVWPVASRSCVTEGALNGQQIEQKGWQIGFELCANAHIRSDRQIATGQFLSCWKVDL
jgi:hypothetical protein